MGGDILVETIRLMLRRLKDAMVLPEKLMPVEQHCSLACLIYATTCWVVRV